MRDVAPRKLPTQARARVTFAALLEATARLLDEAGLAGVTTNRIAGRAGVGIGSLYEYFPGRDAILAALVRERLAGLRGELEGDLAALLGAEPEGPPTRLFAILVERVSRERWLLRLLLREAPFLLELPETRAALGELLALGRRAGERALDPAALPSRDADLWLLTRMLAHAILDVAQAGPGDPDRDLLTRELAVLAARMVRGGH